MGSVGCCSGAGCSDEDGAICLLTVSPKAEAALRSEGEIPMTDAPDSQRDRACLAMLRKEIRTRAGAFAALVLCSTAACGANATPDAASSSDSPCMEAFAAAAAVSPYQDTHEDLFPAYSACTGIDEWKAADTSHPAAIDGVDPVQYAMSVCAGNQSELGETPICKAVNAPPASSSSLEASGRAGLLGVPLPEGAQLTERTPGDLENYVDPREAYAISATEVPPVAVPLPMLDPEPSVVPGVGAS